MISWRHGPRLPICLEVNGAQDLVGKKVGPSPAPPTTKFFWAAHPFCSGLSSSNAPSKRNKVKFGNTHALQFWGSLPGHTMGPIKGPRQNAGDRQPRRRHKISNKASTTAAVVMSKRLGRRRCNGTPMTPRHQGKPHLLENMVQWRRMFGAHIQFSELLVGGWELFVVVSGPKANLGCRPRALTLWSFCSWSLALRCTHKHTHTRARARVHTHTPNASKPGPRRAPG